MSPKRKVYISKNKTV